MNESAIDVLQKHGKSFRFAGMFLDKVQLKQAARLYAFCRWVDDIADENPDKIAAKKRLFAIKKGINRNVADSPELSDFLNLKSELRLPGDQPCSLIDGVISDLESVAVQDINQLMRYAFRVAGVVGLMMCPILRAAPLGYRHAVDLGMAMQLTNIARDVMEDAEMGRRYIPEVWCSRTPGEIVKNLPETQQEVQSAVDKLLNLAEQYYASGAIGFGYLPTSSRRAIMVAATIYREIGIKLKSDKCQYWRGRTVISLPRKVTLSLKALTVGHPLPQQLASKQHLGSLHSMLYDLLPSEH